MAKRPKVYYPKFQITEGLLSGPKEWMLRDTKEEYLGPYHKYADGMVMTGGAYNEAISEFLVPYKDQSLLGGNVIYDNIRKGEDVTKYSAPIAYFPLKFLTLDDYKREWFHRYFVRKRNHVNGRIIEVDKKQFDSLGSKGKGINGKLYMGTSIRWRIAGNQETIQENGATVYGIVEANKRTLFFAEPKMPGITNFLGDLQEFSIYNKSTDSKITDELL